MKAFILSVFAVSAVAAYAGDVANPRCAWTIDGYACTGEAVADAGASAMRKL